MKQVYVKWIPAGEPQVVFSELIDGELKTLQTKVGGYVELVRLSTGIDMYINEEGKLQGLPINKVATQLYRHFRKVTDDLIVGNAILCGSRNGGVVSLSESRQKQIDKLIRGFGAFKHRG